MKRTLFLVGLLVAAGASWGWRVSADSSSGGAEQGTFTLSLTATPSGACDEAGMSRVPNVAEPDNGSHSEGAAELGISPWSQAPTPLSACDNCYANYYVCLYQCNLNCGPPIYCARCEGYCYQGLQRCLEHC
jgi:hypothetical protein